MKPHFHSLFLTGLLAAVVAHAEPVTFSCPQSINVEQSVAVAAKDWLAYNENRHNPYVLDAITFFRGEPSELGALAPGSWRTKKSKKSTAIWKLPKDEHGYWLSCGYRQTTITLIKQLPQTIRRCEVSYEKRDALNSDIKQITCFDYR